MLPLALAGIPLDFSLSDKEVGFYSPGKGEVRYKVDIPKGKMRMCASCLGWLMFVPKAGGEISRENWTLFHPLNVAKIELPDKGIYLRGGIIEKFALSMSPSGTSDYIVMFHTML
ncbi:hypothetical protein ACLB2K_019575 [Fragaria x ananassa]